MEPIRVLQVVTIMNRGGLETMLMNYYRKIDREKIQFDFMTHRIERGQYDDEIEALGGRIYRMSSIRPGNYNKYFKELDEFFKEHKEYKIVHSHINENSGFVLNSARKMGISCRIAHNHVSGLGIDYKLPFRMYARFVLKRSVNNYFACSNEAAKWLFGKNVFEKKNIKILKNSIDTEVFKFDKRKGNEIKNDLNINGKFVVGHVGRFNSSKNHKFLIEVFNEICKINENAVLLLVGDGDLKHKIEKEVTKLGLHKDVKFLGLRGDVERILSAMDVFVFPSKFEALPVTLVEAQAVGVKCIVSTCVPDEVDITNTIEFIDLNKGAKEWAQRICQCNHKKCDYKKIIKEKGYDINQNVQWISSFYIDNYL